MTMYQISLGLNDKDKKVQLVETSKALEITKGIALEYFNGVTIYQCNGGYTHENGQKVDENSIRIEVVYTNIEAVKSFVENIKNVFNQESVLVNIIDASINFW